MMKGRTVMLLAAVFSGLSGIGMAWGFFALLGYPWATWIVVPFVVAAMATLYFIYRDAVPDWE